MKRILAVILSLVMCITISGCTSKENDLSLGENKELTVWAILSSDCTDYATNYQSQWYEEQTGVKINWVTVPQQGWADAFQRSIMNGEWPDIYLYNFDTTEVVACVDFGALIPLNDLITENAPNIRKALENDSELKDLITAPDGNIYTLYSKSYNDYAYTQKLWVNTEWLKKYTAATGNNTPKTLDDFEKMLIYFRDNDMNENGDNNDEIPYLGANGLDGFFTLIGGYIPCNNSTGYGCYVDEKGDSKFTLNTSEFREGLKYITNLYSEGLISDKTFTTEANDRYEYIGNNSSESVVGVTTAVEINGIISLSGNEGDFDYSAYTALEPLSGPEGFSSVVTQGENKVELKNAITTSCKDPELAIKWLDYWYSEEGRLWNINGGQEGKHWWYENGTSINGTGEVVVKSTDSDLMTNACWGKQGVAYMITEEDFCHMDYNAVNTNNSLTNYLADKKYSDHSIRSNWPSIVWVNDEQMDLATEYSELSSLLGDFIVQNYTDFIMGKKDINNDSEWNAYCAKLDDMGLERYIELFSIYCEK